MEINFQNTQNVFGPLAVYRLEGEINGIKKVIYLFGEFHVIRKKCENEVSLEMYQYMAREFRKIEKSKKDKVYDLFLEIHMNKNDTGNNGTYAYAIDDLRNYFSKKLNLENKKIILSKSKNVRFHLLDFRIGIIRNFINNIYTLNQNLNNDYYPENKINEFLKLIDQLLNLLKSKIKPNMDIYEIISKKGNDSYENMNELIHNIGYKIRFSYKNHDIKIILAKYYNDIIKNIQKFEKYVNDNHEDMKKIKVFDKLVIIKKDNTFSYNDYVKIENYNFNLYNLREMINNSFVLLTDLYSLRRFLDKDYVTNVVQYNGALHTMNMIYILVNDFNFNLTHSTVENLTNENLKEAVKKSKINDLSHLFETALPQQFTQCVDLSNFPSNFD